MQIVQHYSHLNGEEYLIVHRRAIYDEIKDTIAKVNASQFKTKISKEKTMPGKVLYSPDALNGEFGRLFQAKSWRESRYSYCVSTDYRQVADMANMTVKEQETYLQSKGVTTPIHSYKQTDFVKESVAVEVQFGKYSFVAYDLFVKHLLFYSGGVINVGVEILAMKSMTDEMSSGIAYYEGEVYNVLRHGRNSPAVPLWIIGVAP